MVRNSEAFKRRTLTCLIRPVMTTPSMDDEPWGTAADGGIAARLFRPHGCRTAGGPLAAFPRSPRRTSWPTT